MHYFSDVEPRLSWGDSAAMNHDVRPVGVIRVAMVNYWHPHAMSSTSAAAAAAVSVCLHSVGLHCMVGKKVTHFNYVTIVPDKLQNTGGIFIQHCLNKYNIRC